MSFAEQSIQKTVEQQHFSTCIDQIIVDHKLICVGVDRPVEQEGMRGDLAQLHDHVLEFHVVDAFRYHQSGCATDTHWLASWPIPFRPRRQTFL